jgi:hypothetical protein
VMKPAMVVIILVLVRGCETEGTCTLSIRTCRKGTGKSRGRTCAYARYLLYEPGLEQAGRDYPDSSLVGHPIVEVDR